MAYNQPGGILGDPVKTRVNSGGEETVESVDRTNTNQRLTNVPMEDRAKGSGASYGKMAAATQSTEGVIGGSEPFRYKSNNKIYNYVPGEQNNNPKTGYKL